MSIEKVREFFRSLGREDEVLEFDVSSATVELAAAAVGVEGARIAKTLSFKKDEKCILVVTAGDTKISNAKFKAKFNTKAKMLTAEEVLAFTGHAVGGVCPFALTTEDVTVYLDESMKRFDTVYPACGSGNSAIELTCEDLFELSGAVEWVDVCDIRQAQSGN